MANKEKDVKKTSSGSTGAKSSKSANSGAARNNGTSGKGGKSRRSADEKYDVYDYEEIYGDADEGADVPAKREKAPVDVSAPKYQVIMLLMAAIALFIIICYIFPDFCGFVGRGIRSFLYGTFSGAAMLVPFLLLLQAIYLKRDLKSGSVLLKVFFSLSAVIFLSVMLHAIFCIFNADIAGLAFADVKEFYANGKDFIGGGVVGGVFGALLVSAVGIPGTMIFSILFLIVFCIFLFGLTPQMFWKRIAFYFFRYCENRQKRKKARAAARAREEFARAAAAQTEEETNEYAAYSPNTDTDTRAYSRYDAYGTNTNEVHRSRGDIDEIFDRDLINTKPENKKVQKPEKKKELSHKAQIKEDKAFRGSSVEDYMRRSEMEEKTPDVTSYTPVREPAPVKKKTERSMENAYYTQYDETLSPMERTVEDVTVTEAPIERTASVAHALRVTEDKIEVIPSADAFSGTTAKEEAEDIFEDDFDDEIIPPAPNPIPEEAPPEEDEDDVPWDDSYDELIGGNKAEPIAPPAQEKKSADPLADELRRTLDITRRRMRGESIPEEKSVAASATAAVAAMPEEPVQEEAIPEPPRYIFPPLELLKPEPAKTGGGRSDELQLNAQKLVETLRSFNVRAHVVDVASGPTVTRYEIGLEAGTRVRQIMNLVDDISYALATNGVRIEGVIPGKSAIGIEVPNKSAETVYLRTLLENPKFADAKSKLTAALGRSVSGDPVYLDIAKMPHLMIAGTTGSGKSVCINTMLISLLYKATPEEVKLVLIDPKKVELNVYNGIPHLLVPVVFDPKKAAGALHWCVTEMERRFDLIESMNVRNIAGYNEAIADDPTKEKLPQIVIVIDELADLMMTAANEVETSICRIAQKARAAGMHLIIGTQRPSVDVITGLIKANVPSRIAFTVMSQVDSRTIIDASGAEKLIGRGDMLYAPVGCTKPMRAQGAFVSDAELESIIEFIKENSVKEENHAENTRAIMERIEKEAALCGKKGKAREEAEADLDDDGEEEEDPKLKSAIQLAVESGKISTSLIQRKLSLGYGRAAKLIDVMERRGIVAPPEGQKPREVLITKEQYLQMMMNDDTGASAQGTLTRDDIPEDEI
ncbi:MAG: DUF87 domain-containing protein [Ruminococcaceae bacterium]|nr:DUF87 domain-containing protein [Oscillospiraceae bacterium]